MLTWNSVSWLLSQTVPYCDYSREARLKHYCVGNKTACEWTEDMLVGRGHHRHPVIQTSFLCLMWHASYHIFLICIYGHMDTNMHVPKSLNMVNSKCCMIWIDLTNMAGIGVELFYFFYVQQKKLLKSKKKDRGALSVWNIPRAHWRMCWRGWAGPCCRHTPLPRRSGSGTALRSWAAQSPLCTVYNKKQKENHHISSMFVCRLIKFETEIV